MTQPNLLNSAIQHDNTVAWSHVQDGLVVSEVMVCKSAAGYYPGRMCFDHDCEFIEPYSRKKVYGYFPTKSLVEEIIAAMG